MVELSTRISWLRSVYRPRTLTSEVRMVVSALLPGLKKRAAMPPKPQLVSRERTAKGKARSFLFSATAGGRESLCGRGMVKGTRSFLLGTVSTGGFCPRCANADTKEISNKRVKRRALIYNI